MSMGGTGSTYGGTGGGTGAGATDPVSMRSASTSQSVDSVGTGGRSDGGASWLQSILGVGSNIGTQVIAGNQSAQAQKTALQLAQLKAQTTTSTSTMLVLAAVAVVVIFIMVKD